MPTVARAFSVPLTGPLPDSLASLLATYRLLVNEILREALRTGTTSRGALSRFARERAFVHRMTGTHAVAASGIALGLAKAHRRRIRKGIACLAPCVRRAFLRADDSSFHIDTIRGRVRISLRYGVWSSFGVMLSSYHRGVLAQPGVRIKQLHLTADRVVFFYERPAPEVYPPTSLLAFDTNESSLDGVRVSANSTRAVTVAFPALRVIQQRHFTRRRRLARKKSHDRRVGRILLRREGRREHHRVTSRMHVLTKRLVEFAHTQRAAIALEDFSKLVALRLPARRRQLAKEGAAPRSRVLRRRLSSWPRRELHRQIVYKAQERGVPIVWVDPFRTSVTCPRCGAYAGPRSRMGPTFVCLACDWRLDRQLNAGANVGRIALRETVELGGLSLDLDALARDAVRPLYSTPERGRARAERTVGEGIRPGRRIRRLPN